MNQLDLNEEISKICLETKIKDEHSSLISNINRLGDSFQFRHVLCYNNWYHLGGIVNQAGERICSNVLKWIENEASGDLDLLMSKYLSSGYIVSKFIGKTHFFVSANGEKASDFIQLEIEELQECHSHYLFDKNSQVEDLEELTSPLRKNSIEPQYIGNPFYSFRRIQNISELFTDIDDISVYGRNLSYNKRMMDEWDKSTASGQNNKFCDHWIFNISEYTDDFGETICHIKPRSTAALTQQQIDLIKDYSSLGLSNSIHKFDRLMAYPMAWYFYMLTHRDISNQIARDIVAENLADFDYLAEKNLSILKEWDKNPYCF